MKVYFMCGIPGSGKSTWIKNNLNSKVKIISRDIIRAELGFCEDGEKKVLSFIKEELVTTKEYEMIKECLTNNTPFVIDDINTKAKYRRKMISFIRENSTDVTLVGVIMTTPLNVCIERRANDIPSDIMKSLYKAMSIVTTDEVDEIVYV